MGGEGYIEKHRNAPIHTRRGHVALRWSSIDSFVELDEPLSYVPPLPEPDEVGSGGDAVEFLS